MLRMKLVPLSVLVVAATAFGLTHTQAQVVTPITDQAPQTATRQVAPQEAQTAPMAAGAVQGCNGCQSAACNGGCGMGVMGRLRNALPSVQMSFGGNNGCGCAYRSVFGGWNELDDYNGFDPTGNPAAATFNDGFILGTARGRYLNNCTRVELEGAWRNNSGESWTGPPANGQLDGHMNNFSTMVNLLHDFPSNGRFNFYGGIGAGFSRQDGDFTVAGNAFEFDDWAFAYQAIAGLNINRNQCSDLFVEYRYFGNTETEIEGPANVVFDDYNYNAENIVFGLRFKR